MRANEIDDRDRAIVRALMSEGRLTNLELAERFSVTLEQQGRATLDRFELDERRHPEIIECYFLAGATDYLLRVASRDARDFERIHTDILTQLPGVSRVQSTLALRTVKKTTALPV